MTWRCDTLSFECPCVVQYCCLKCVLPICGLYERCLCANYCQQSINDGRLFEQMFRLRRSPIDRVIFVIEGKQESLTARAKVAMAELQTQGAQVMLVNTLRDFSMALIHLTDNLKRKLAVTLQSLKDSPQVPPPVRLSDGAMVVCDSGVPMTWRAFEQDASKSMNLSATDVWGKQLLQLHGVSPPKARVIATVFPTPMALREYVQRQLRRMTREDCMVELRAKLRNNEVSVGPSIAAMLVSIVLGMDDV